jgi:hypothetical protein
MNMKISLSWLIDTISNLETLGFLYTKDHWNGGIIHKLVDSVNWCVTIESWEAMKCALSEKN